MKRVRVCMFIFAVLVIFSVAVFAKTDYDLYEIERAVAEAAETYERGEYDRTRKAAVRAREEWDDFAQREFLLADKSNLVEIPMLLTQVEVEAEVLAEKTADGKGGGAEPSRNEIAARCHTLNMIITSFRNKQKQLL